MHETVIIFMFSEVGGRGRVASKSQEEHKTVSIFMVLEVGGKGAAGFRIIRNP